MIKKVAAVFVGMWVLTATASAQRVEGSVGGGYTFSDGVDFDDLNVLGTLSDEVGVDSGGSMNFTIGGYVTPRGIVEFLYNRQWSQLTARGFGATTNVSELAINDYHVNFAYNVGGFESPAQPFVSFGLGATNYQFGSLLLPNTGQEIGDETKFSVTLGFGIKYYASRHVGLKAGAQWTPTYIKNSGTTAAWCDPFYGCWTSTIPEYSNQFDLNAGVVFRY